MFCSVPSIGFSEASREADNWASDVLNNVEIGDSSNLIKDFDDLEKIIAESDDPLTQARQFLDSFINELNSRSGLSLTTKDACFLVRDNIHLLPLSFEEKNLVLSGIKLLEPSIADEIGELVQQNGFYWPHEWNWFGLNKSGKSENKNTSHPLVVMNRTPLQQEELPGNIYFGSFEIIGGVLVWLVPLPGTSALAGIMIGDGVRRIADGVIQVSDERRADPNFVNPKPPF